MKRIKTKRTARTRMTKRIAKMTRTKMRQMTR